MRLYRNETKYEHRMLDAVVDNDIHFRRRVGFMKRFKNLIPQDKNMPKMLRQTYALVDTLSKHTEMLNAKILSPRFGAITDDDRDVDTALVDERSALVSGINKKKTIFAFLDTC